MSKTVLAEVNGWTPTIDTIVTELGVLSAVVFGKVWRYCQMEDGVCKAAQEKMAGELGISRVCFNQHVDKLIKAEYLEDTTPRLLGKPHIYKDTGKAGLSISFTAKPQPVNEVYSTCKPNLQQPVNEVYSKKVVKREDKNTTTKEKTAEIFKVYEQEIGILTPFLAEQIGGYLDNPKCPPDYIIDAIHEARRNQKCNWAYCEAILKNWITNGKGAKPKPATPCPSEKKGSRADFLAKLAEA